MAQKMTFTDSAISRIKAGAKPEYYSDKTYRGLRLLVAPGGSKTWYASKWNPVAQKSQQAKIGQFPHMTRDMAWAEATRLKSQIDAGAFETRKEVAARVVVEESTLPTLREALEEYIAHRSGDRASGKDPMREGTADSYRATFDLHLSAWADVIIDALPTRNINAHLNALQLKAPHAAFRAHAIVGAVVRYACKAHAITVAVPSLIDPTKQTAREIDREIDWADIWADINGVDNVIRRACWKMRFLTGTRENVLRELTWDQVDLEAGAITFAAIKRDIKGRRIVVADAVGDILRELHAWTGAGKWVFPSPRLGVHIDKLRRDELPAKTVAPGDLRHYYGDALEATGASLMVRRWLVQQTLQSNEIAMLGRYAQPDDEVQRIAANKATAYIMSRCGVTSRTVLEMRRTAS
jgi:integrase